MSGSSTLMPRPTVIPLRKPATEDMSDRRVMHLRSASLKLSTKPSPSWSYLKVEAVDHQSQLPSRGLQASYLRNTDNCTAAPSPSSDVGSASVWSTQLWQIFASCSSTGNQLFEQPTGRHSCWGPATIYLIYSHQFEHHNSYNYTHYTCHHAKDTFMCF